MRLLRLAVAGFRNLPPCAVDVDAPVIAFVGENGQGKTNWLEAAGVLGTLRSFRSPRQAELIAWGESTAMVEGLVRSDGMTRKLSWTYGATRGLKRDDRNVDSVGWLSSFRASYFVPGDIAPIRGEPALRRALLDRAVLGVDPSYLTLARDYRRVLEHKVALLRGQRVIDAEVEVIDAQLVKFGTEITLARGRVLSELEPIFSSVYADFAGGEPATVRYEPWLGTGDRAALEARFHEELGRVRARERLIGRPLAGPHRDDLTFRVCDHAARAYASQGQARSAMLAWKLAEITVARAEGQAPVFLLDDLGSELDPGRTTRLLASLASLHVQTFLSTTDERFVPTGTPGTEVRVFQVRSGALVPGAGAGSSS